MVLDSFDIKVFNLEDFIKCWGENVFNKVISSYKCPINLDIELFLKEKAVSYQNRKPIKTKTFLVFNLFDNRAELCGYFSLVNAPFVFNDDYSKSYWKKLTGGLPNKTAISAILIGQFGKNYDNHLMTSISGKNLLIHLLELLVSVEYTIGLNLVYLECEDHPKLRQFYETNGFHLNVDKEGNPIKAGKDSHLLCYVAKFEDLIVEK